MSENQNPQQQYPAEPQPAPKTGSKRRKTLMIVGAAVAIVAAGTIGYTLSDKSAQSATPTAATTSAPATPSGGTAGGAPGTRTMRGHGVMGTIASEAADSWTITGRDGTTTTVTITPQTTFGTKKSPEQESQFAVGDRVVVRGTNSNGTVTATAISEAHRPGSTTAQTGESRQG